MAKSKDRSEVEHLRAMVKQQRSIIKHLKKEVGRSNKRAHQHEDLEERLAEEMLHEYKESEEKVDDKKCPNCSKSKLEFISLGKKTLCICQNCDYRKTR